MMLLLGSTNYDSSNNKSDDGDFEYETTQTVKDKSRCSKLFASEEIKREVRLMNKISGEENRKRTATKYQNKKIRAQKLKKLMDKMNKVVTPGKKIKNCTSVTNPFTPSSSASVSGSPTITTSTLCGYQVNTIELSCEKVDTVQSATMTQPDPNVVACQFRI